MKQHTTKISPGMMLVTIGIVFGDIGTSPMYVMKSILEGNGGISGVDDSFIVGALSLAIWTITLLTTFKYVCLALSADNHGEGGIFSLYSLVRKYGKFLIVPTMIGGCMMLADGILTPAVTVTTAVEGLRSIPVMNEFLGEGQTVVIIFTILIICLLFLFQRNGTSRIGMIFGPVMLVWFLFLGETGLIQIIENPFILKAINPVYAISVLFSENNKAGFMILGSVFLCTTGAEALYADMGHVGKGNIRATWPFVKLSLILSYMGQCSWIISNKNDAYIQSIEDLNPFYMMLPENMRPFAVLLSALAAIIASQALISGSYTLVHEATSINLMPRFAVRYPSDTKGQIYIPLVNTILMLGCIFVVLYFRSGARIENAYGLAITMGMLMTTVLFTVYIWCIKGHKLLAVIFALLFGALETVFVISSLGKFLKGGYFALMVSLVLLIIMIAWYRGTQIERKQRIYLKMEDYIDNIRALKEDKEIPLCCNNLVYLYRDSDNELIDRDILYSILDKDPKRAEAYWFVSVINDEQPYGGRYSVETFGTDFIFRIHIYLGYKMDQRVNRYMRQIVSDLMKERAIPPQTKKHSIYDLSKIGNFKFCIIKKLPPTDQQLSARDTYLVKMKYTIRKLIGDEIHWFGLEAANVIEEFVPMLLPQNIETRRLKRIEKE